jgi:CheY-like chemotaxis protein
LALRLSIHGAARIFCSFPSSREVCKHRNRGHRCHGIFIFRKLEKDRLCAPLMNVLLIEDDRRIAELVERGLKENGHRVSVSNNGVQGSEMMLEGKFDAALLDILLPGMDGFAVLEKVRAPQDWNLPDDPVFIEGDKQLMQRLLGIPDGQCDQIYPRARRDLCGGGGQ